jgi:hypothetical protein
MTLSQTRSLRSLKILSKILSWFLDVELSGDWQILTETELSHFRVLNILYFHYIPKCWESVVLDHTIDYNDKNI